MGNAYEADQREKDIYALICASDGIKAKDIGRQLGLTRADVNRCLARSPFIRDLCYQDTRYAWHGLIPQRYPHRGLTGYCGWYGTADRFAALDAAAWFAELQEGCRAIGRNLNDARGLFHSFRDCGDTIRALLADLRASGVACGPWELGFELRIKRSERIRIYADVLVIAPGYAFVLEFKMKDRIDPAEIAQAVKYCPYLEVLLGPAYEVVPALVLTRAADLFEHRRFGAGTAELAVCSGDMLFNVFEEYLGFLG